MSINEKIIKHLLAHQPKTADDLGDVLRKFLRKEKTPSLAIPAKSALLKSYHILLKQNKIKKSVQLEKLLVKRAVRTLSGVTIVTLLTKPFPCPGKCVYCPTEARMPKSYISDEPAAARALNLMFDPFQQTIARIKALEANGHPTDKIELIVKGGTWNTYPVKYQYWFIARCFEACNRLSLRGEKRRSNLHKNSGIAALLSVARNDMVKLQKINEKAKHRIIGLTLETRPDFINEKNIKIMRELGCTRIELGVQTTNEKILKLIKRGHDTQEVKRATKMLKNYGFKVDYHLMPQLPGATPITDLKMMLKVFDDQNYRPDMIKVYPCTVVKTSELYDWLKRGEYKTYSNRELINMLKKFKAEVPRYVRISRLIRDIPGHHIQAGNTMTNLRQVIQAEMKKDGLKCNCLRCREIGHQHIKSQIQISKSQIKLFADEYEASGGMEYFLSYEDKNRDVVYAFCRLRINQSVIPSEARADEGSLSVIPRLGGVGLPATLSLARRAGVGWQIGQRFLLRRRNDKTISPTYPAFIRELHTYGQLVGIGKKTKGASQHIGMGVKLVKKAEELARKAGADKLAVISGVGVRGYYKKLGYKLENTYMVKSML